MTSTLYLPKVVSPDEGLAALRAVDWLSLGAAPTFAFMAALTGILGGGAHEMLCSAATYASPLSGLVPMYVLMSAFHFAPWLKLISRWRNARPRILMRQPPRDKLQLLLCQPNGGPPGHWV